MDKPIEIDLHGILRSRLPRNVGRIVPGFLISGLERLIRQKELNEMLRAAFPARGSAFARKILEHLGVTVEVKGLENLEGHRRLMFASNHPLGGLDGIALIAVLGERYGDDGIRFLVNDMLMNVEPLRDMFIPVNKYGRQGETGHALSRRHWSRRCTYCNSRQGSCRVCNRTALSPTLNGRNHSWRNP